MTTARLAAAIKLTDVTIDDLIWDGSGGSCGALNSDPRGQYWVAGASRAADGTLHLSGPTMFAVGKSAHDRQIRERITFVERLLDEAGLRQHAPGTSVSSNPAEPPSPAVRSSRRP